MNDKEMLNIIPEQQKELINILMESELYLDLPLEERNLLLKFLLQSYSYPANKGNRKEPSRFI
jgi:hypothetical protein